AGWSLEALVFVEAAEALAERGGRDDPHEAPRVLRDRPPDRQELASVRHVDPARHQQLARRVQVEVVALVPALLAGRADPRAEVRLVGRLVLREAHVAVDPVDALARRHVAHLGLEARDAQDHLLHQLLELRAQALVLGAVRLEPGLAVVGLEAGKELHQAAKVHGSREPTAAPAGASTVEGQAALRWIQPASRSGSGSPRAFSSAVEKTLFEAP